MERLASQKLDIEATKRIFNNALEKRNYMSEDEEEKPKEHPREVAVLGKRKKADQAVMHGATVVPEPAFIKHRKLLEKQQKK